MPHAVARLAMLWLLFALMPVGAHAQGGSVHFRPLVVAREQTLNNGMTGDNFIFGDVDGHLRQAFMLPNDRQDALGTWGGCLHRFVYEVDGAERICAANNKNHPGFGYTVNHFPGSSTSSRFVAGEFHDDFIGRHHAIRRYRWLQKIDGKLVDTTVAWLFQSGRNSLVWAVTYDLHHVPADALLADTRAPYGDIAWDGGANAEVAGLSWGDRYVFRTTHSPVTESTGWDYSQPNETHVPHVRAWSELPDAEMGVVQTSTFERHDAGGYDGWRLWGQSSPDGPMPGPTSWPFQLNQYELPYTTTSKRMAWGSNYGAVGQRVASKYGDDGVLVGWPYASYSTLITLGPHSAEPTLALAEEVQTSEKSTLSAIAGATIASSAPAGVARSDRATLLTPGLDPTWYAWTASWTSGASRAELLLDVPKHGMLSSPLFVVDNYPGHEMPVVRLDGRRLVHDAEVLISLDAEHKRLYVTVVGPWRHAHRLTLVAQPTEAR